LPWTRTRRAQAGNPAHSLKARVAGRGARVYNDITMMTRPRRLEPRQFGLLADALGDTPETTISVHLLGRGLCRAYVIGDPERFLGAIVQDNHAPDEPTAFGADPHILWELLQIVPGWECIEVESGCAAELGEIISANTAKRIRYYEDVYHVLLQPVRAFTHAAVRKLTLSDLDLLKSTPDMAQGIGFGSLQMLLEEGVVACAIVAGQIVSIAHTYARTTRHADIGVHTLDTWRGHGFATAAASIVAGCIQEAGQTPVWSTGEDNWASLRVAQKLGFVEMARRTYVIPTASNRK
jgi:hypothetical protein